jgi:hypothetical protein
MQEFALTLGMTKEVEHIREMGRIKYEEMLDAKRLLDKLLENENLYAEEKAEIKNKLKVLDIEISTQLIKNANDVTEAIKKQTKAEDDLFEAERKRKNEQGNRQAQSNADANREALQQLKDRTSSAGLGGGFVEGFLASISIMADATLKAADKMASATNQIKVSWQSMGGVVMSAINGLLDGIGQLIQNWILMGSTAPGAMRKLVATVLAGVAAQAAILAIFETAKGFAALFFNPAEAAAHFTAAALFGSIAVGTAIAGRAAAGDLFNQQAGAATGGGNAATGNSSQTNFGGQFGGFGNGSNSVGGRIMEVLGGVEEQLYQFNVKYGLVSPGQVVMAGAGDASREIARAYEGELGGDVRSTDRLMRNTGQAR